MQPVPGIVRMRQRRFVGQKIIFAQSLFFQVYVCLSKGPSRDLTCKILPARFDGVSYEALLHQIQDTIFICLLSAEKDN